MTELQRPFILNIRSLHCSRKMLFVMKVLTLALVACATLLVGCGGGGSTGSPTLPPGPTATATPTPSATVSGKVAQLAGPLAANGSPSPQSTPVAGAGVAGVTVYITAATTAALVSPQASPLATATTAPDGTFSVTFANPTRAASFGVVAVNGTTVGTNGVTNLGYTVAHEVVAAGSTTTLYVDTLTANEQAGFTAYNAARVSANMPAVESDTALEMAARLSIVNNEATGKCSGDQNTLAEYSGFGGVNLSGLAMVAPQSTTPYYNTWPSQVTFPAQTGLDFAAFAGPVIGGVACPSSGSSLPQNYFAELLLVG